MSTKEPGVVLGLNAAFQRRVAFEKPLVIGAVNRAAESGGGVGGKGQGAYLAAAAARPGSVALAQFYGGDAGDALAEALRKRASGADEALWIRTASQTRICTTLVADGNATEIVEPSGAVTATELDALRAALASRTAPGLLAAGSLPPGVPADFYSTCAAATLAQGGKFLIDAVAGLEDAVAAAASVGARMVLKVNARELLLAAGDPLAAGAADSVDDPARTAHAARALAAKLSSDALAAILWTDGPHPGGALVGDAVYALAGPSLSEFGPVLSPIGAGDTVAGTTFAKWLENDDPVGAFAYGLACGAASCLTAENAVFDADVAAAIHAKTVVTKTS
jgi:1-phosphofructokinase